MRFDFKQFSVLQDRCAMKVGTDGVLLGCCASIEGHERQILDIGTGTGLLALMMAQRLSEKGNTYYNIKGVEIDAKAAAQAAENFAASPWSSHLEVHACSLEDYMQQHPSGNGVNPSLQGKTREGLDLIICNPPFYNATLKPDDEARAVARHKDSLPLSQIMQFAQEHLSEQGRLSLIYPTEYNEEVTTAALLSHLRPNRIVRIFTKVGKPCKRLISEFVRQDNNATPLVAEELFLRDADSQYSADYRNITKPFYLSLR